VLGSSFLIITVKIFAGFLFQKDFYSAWIFVPPLLISVIFGALTGFLGSICLAHKDSRSMGIATGIGAVLNIVLNLISVWYIGAMGAAIATAISYFTMYFMAFLFTKKHVRLSINLKKDYLAYLIVVVQAVLVMREVKNVYPITILLFILLLLLYLKEASAIAKRLLAYGKKKHNKED
jgi:O-antigen/teichoic acid export membrane protein